MSSHCHLVVFSNKAYNAIIRESFDKDPVETGGILLGHVLDNGVWIVMEVLPPGINSIFQYAYFEYDEAFVNYLAQSVANQYERPLDLLGLWHRHPGNMDVFSTTDDGTNLTFARLNPAGVISGLVNIDPKFRFTMYHLDHPTSRPIGRPHYEVVDVEVGDDIIPDEYFRLRYVNGDEADLHPTIAQRANDRLPRQVVSPTPEADVPESEASTPETPAPTPAPAPQNNDSFFALWRDLKKKWWYLLIAIAAVLLSVSTFKSCKSEIKNVIDTSQSESTQTNTDQTSASLTPSLSAESLAMEVAGVDTIKVLNQPANTVVVWKVSQKSVISVKDGVVVARNPGNATVSAWIGKDCIGSCQITVSEESGFNDSDANPYGIPPYPDDVDQMVKDILSRVGLTHNSGTTTKGRSFPLPVVIEGTPDVKYESKNPSVATVQPNGVVTAKGVGTTQILITYADSTLVYTVKVTK